MAAAVMQRNQASRVARNPKTLATANRASLNGSSFFCQPIAKKAPAASNNSRKWLTPPKLGACSSVIME